MKIGGFILQCNTPPWVIFMFFEFYKWYQIMQIVSCHLFCEFFFLEHSQCPGQEGKGEAISLVPLYHFQPNHIFRHQLGDYYRKLTSPHSQQPASNQEPLFSERKLLTSNVCTLIISISKYLIKENAWSIFVQVC